MVCFPSLITCTESGGSYTTDIDSENTIIGDEPTLTKFNPVHEHPEEDLVIRPQKDLGTILSDLIQPGENLELSFPKAVHIEKKRSGFDT